MKAAYILALLSAVAVSAAPVAEKRQLGDILNAIPDGVLPENVQQGVDAVQGVVDAVQGNNDDEEAVAADDGAAAQEQNAGDAADDAAAEDEEEAADAEGEDAAAADEAAGEQNQFQQILDLVQGIAQTVNELRNQNDAGDAAAEEEAAN